MTHAYNTDGPPWVCSCGWVYARKGEPVMSEEPPRNCPRASQPPPIDPETLKPAAEKLGISWEDVAHYAQALARWAAAGFPTRTQAEVRACLLVCIDCGQYVPNATYCTSEACKIASGGRCKLCGCNVTASRVALVNKAKMATEHCPAGKWPGDPPLTTPASGPTPPPQ